MGFGTHTRCVSALGLARYIQFNVTKIMLDDLGYTLHMGKNGDDISLLIQT